MLIEQSAVEVNIDASNGALKVQQSIQQSLVNIDLGFSGGFKKEEEKTRADIEQSIINIDFWSWNVIHESFLCKYLRLNKILDII